MPSPLTTSRLQSSALSPVLKRKAACSAPRSDAASPFTRWAMRWWPPPCRASIRSIKVSIIPRGVGALGYTIQRPTEDRFLLARHDPENRISVLMGGRAAEALVFDGEVSTGAS